MSSSALSFAPWEYRELLSPLPETEPAPLPEALPLVEAPRFTQEEVAVCVEDALRHAREQWSRVNAEEQTAAEARLAEQLKAFEHQRAAYLRQAEIEVVQLVLGIARRILQREAALDPALLAGLVRVAMDRVAAGTPARLHVSPEALAAWQRAQACGDGLSRLQLVADSTLETAACRLEAGAATAPFHLETQLKDMEQSFSDLMAVRTDAFPA